MLHKSQLPILLLMTLSAIPQGCNSYYAVRSALSQLTTSDLIDRTYLATDRGKKVALAKYDPLGEPGR